MKKLLSLLAVTVLAGSVAFAAEEKTIKGEGVCAKCQLGETKTCQNAIQVKENGQTVTYYLADNDASKAFHKKVCKGKQDHVVAKGTVEEKDGKKVLTASKVNVAKE